MNKKSVISIGGGVAILLGCFLPAIHAPFIGSVSYMVGSDGKLVAGLSLLIIILALCQRIGWAAFLGAVVALIAAVDFTRMLSLFESQTGNQLSDSLIKATSPGEAWALIAIGIVTVFAALFIPDAKAPEPPASKPLPLPMSPKSTVVEKWVKWCRANNDV